MMNENANRLFFPKVFVFMHKIVVNKLVLNGPGFLLSMYDTNEYFLLALTHLITKIRRNYFQD